MMFFREEILRRREEKEVLGVRGEEELAFVGEKFRRQKEQVNSDNNHIFKGYKAVVKLIH
jgi:hypothetical protein